MNSKAILLNKLWLFINQLSHTGCFGSYYVFVHAIDDDDDDNDDDVYFDANEAGLHDLRCFRTALDFKPRGSGQGFFSLGCQNLARELRGAIA